MATVSTHPPGTRVRFEMTKWGDRPHWHFDGIALGSDEHGEWVGFPKGTHNSRPGYEFDSEVDSVSLVPTQGWHISTFHTPGIWCDLYVDITTPAAWHGGLLTAVDLDLDVIRMASVTPPKSPLAPQDLSAGPGEVFVDDEDEFADHQVTYAYPSDLIEAARTSCDAVLAAVRAGRAPFDGAHERWLRALAELSRA